MNAQEAATLRGIVTDLDEFIQCADTEHFPDSYKKDPATFAVLLKIERKLETAAKEYLKELAEQRATGYVNWTLFTEEAAKNKKAGEFDYIINDASAAIEAHILLQKLYDLIYSGAENGAQAAINIYHPAMQFDTLQEIVEDAARQYSSTLVSGVSDTTRNLLRSSIATSIKLGETMEQAKARIQNTINNPVRAEMIAKSESTNSYGLGIMQLGDATGATGKYLSVILDRRTSEVCRQMSKKYGSEAKAIPLNEPFSVELASAMQPGFHVRCRTGLVLTYKPLTKEVNLEEIMQKSGMRPNADINTEIEKLLNSDKPDKQLQAIKLALQLPKDDAAAMLSSISFNGKSVVDGYYKMQLDPKTLKVTRVLKDPARDPLKMTAEEIAAQAGIKIK